MDKLEEDCARILKKYPGAEGSKEILARACKLVPDLAKRFAKLHQASMPSEEFLALSFMQMKFVDGLSKGMDTEGDLVMKALFDLAGALYMLGRDSATQ
jgi:hypothetical protein